MFLHPMKVFFLFFFSSFNSKQKKQNIKKLESDRCYLVCVYVTNDGINHFFMIRTQVISQTVPELFNFYISTLILIKVLKGLVQVFIVSNLF